MVQVRIVMCAGHEQANRLRIRVLRTTAARECCASPRARSDNRTQSSGYHAKSGIIFLMKQVPESRRMLESLGRRLRRARLDRNDTMAAFAERIGVSERTVRAMEHGLPTVQIGTWLDALWIVDGLRSLDQLLENRESLLEQARRQQRRRQRQRASRRKP